MKRPDSLASIGLRSISLGVARIAVFLRMLRPLDPGEGRGGFKRPCIWLDFPSARCHWRSSGGGGLRREGMPAASIRCRRGKVLGVEADLMDCVMSVSEAAWHEAGNFTSMCDLQCAMRTGMEARGRPRARRADPMEGPPASVCDGAEFLHRDRHLDQCYRTRSIGCPRGLEIQGSLFGERGSACCPPPKLSESPRTVPRLPVARQAIPATPMACVRSMARARGGHDELFRTTVTSSSAPTARPDSHREGSGWLCELIFEANARLLPPGTMRTGASRCRHRSGRQLPELELRRRPRGGHRIETVHDVRLRGEVDPR